jgi:hypothetical protein
LKYGPIFPREFIWLYSVYIVHIVGCIWVSRGRKWPSRVVTLRVQANVANYHLQCANLFGLFLVITDVGASMFRSYVGNLTLFFSAVILN